MRPGVRLLVWGRADLGQLGLGQASEGFPVGDAGAAVPLPTPLEALSGKDVVGFAAGPFHSAFVTADGELYTTGCNDNGQLGRRITPANIAAAAAAAGASSTSSSSPPACSYSLAPGHVTALESYGVAAVGCGGAHTLALTD
ncbi:hypothetical protein Agub_g11182, partial [Astrephomene gubernaculifera]